MTRHLDGVLWVVSLLSLILASVATRKFSLLVLAIAFVVSLVIVIPLHFYKTWKRFSRVPNKRAFAVWVGLEMIATTGLIALVLYSVLSH